MELDLVQLALIATEAGETVDRLAHRFGDDVVLDDIGMRAVPASAARGFFAERAEQKADMAARQKRRQAQLAARPRPAVVGVPAKDGLDPVAAMTSQDPAYTTPSQDFGPNRGNPRQEFMDEMLDDGRRAMAAMREKARLAREKREKKA